MFNGSPTPVDLVGVTPILVKISWVFEFINKCFHILILEHLGHVFKCAYRLIPKLNNRKEVLQWLNPFAEGLLV
jgi:hypothetical protein